MRCCSELAKATPGRVLASGAVLDAAGPAEAARWRRSGEATVRGRTEPTRLAVPRVVADGAAGQSLSRR